MTIKNTFTSMADHLRSEYGTPDLLTVDQIKSGINGLHTHNYLDAGQSLSFAKDGEMKPLSGIDAETWDKKFLGKTITISFDAKWSGIGIGNRMGIEYAYIDKTGQDHYYGAWITPNQTQGTQHFAQTFTIDTIGSDSLTEYHMYAQVGASAKVEITNPKIVINPMGGNPA